VGAGGSRGEEHLLALGRSRRRDGGQAGSDRRELGSASTTTTAPVRPSDDHHALQRRGSRAGEGKGKGKERAEEDDREEGEEEEEAEAEEEPSSPPTHADTSDPDRDRVTRSVLEEYEAEEDELHHQPQDTTTPLFPSSQHSSSSNNHSSHHRNQKPPGPTRKQSLLPQQETALIRSLLASDDLTSPLGEQSANYIAYNDPNVGPSMVSRKVWVKRPGASPTLVTVLEDQLVDDVRDMILKKYANTLGRNFDSPDVTLRIVPRENRQERTLGPEEPICQILDGYFPGGQTVDEALVIDVPLRRTPRPSPQPMPRYYQEEERRPQEAASEYFPPMPVPTVPSPHLPGMMPGLVQRRTRSPSAISRALHVHPDHWSRS
jgi:osomolarity two-component system response regulator SSK1